MSYDARKKALDKMQPAAWAVDDWLRQHCTDIGMLHFALTPIVCDTGIDPELVVEALFELDGANLIRWDQEDLVVYICGWALDKATPNGFVQILWRAKATKWPDTGPRAQLESELELVKQSGKRLQLVSSCGEPVNGPKRLAGVRR